MLALSFIAEWVGVFALCVIVVVLAMVGTYLLMPVAAALYVLLRPGETPGGATVPIPGTRPRISPELRLRVLERDGWACQVCGSKEDLELDHEIPWSRGGATTYENLRVLCDKCNHEKGAK